ncbi:hypothetical protein BH20ACI4_BH20ACI4_14990 [soil metagenome]
MLLKVISQVSILFILVLIFCCAESDAQNRRDDQPLSEELYKVLDERAELLSLDLSASKDKEWVGVYYQGDHHPTRFVVTPNAGFLVTSSNHTFSPSWINYGKVEFKNNRLKIYPELEKENQYAHLMPTEFDYIRWDETHFLIPPDQLINFAYAVHSESDQEIMQFFARGMYSDVSRKGLPDLPEKYKKILTMKSVKPKIIAIDDKTEKYFDSRFTLNIGRKQNVIEGMIFYYTESKNFFALRVSEVNENTSEASVTTIGGSGEEDFSPKIGMKLTSKVTETSSPQDFQP